MEFKRRLIMFISSKKFCIEERIPTKYNLFQYFESYSTVEPFSPPEQQFVPLEPVNTSVHGNMCSPIWPCHIASKCCAF